MPRKPLRGRKYHPSEKPKQELYQEPEASSFARDDFATSLLSSSELGVVVIPQEEYLRLQEEAEARAEAELQVKRWQADFENYRRRVTREREEFIQYASLELIQRLLPVLDNYERALAASANDPQSFRDGVEMIYRQQLEVLIREGLEVVDPAGEPFDPNFHEAVLSVAAEEGVASQTVVEVLQKGYILRGRLLRPALVKVAN
ncbi:MAG: nucleotide exchange factor GrpE [Symbiobacteriaceae bacterium]|nr:nucleotide exchange factor GrpE [Symbiobacteriaceae bacterium]